MGRPNLVIIIPAKNEAKTVGKIIKFSIKFGDVVVIDDASKDGTDQICTKNGAKLLKNKKSLFYDGSLNKGFSFAKRRKYKFIITLDADGEHDLKMVPIFLKHLKAGNDLILGKRKVLPRLSEKIISYYYKKKFNVSDLYCGMKGYNAKWINHFKVFDRFGSIGTDLATRIIQSQKSAYKEINVKIYKRKDKPRIGKPFFADLKIFKSFFLNLIIN